MRQRRTALFIQFKTKHLYNSLVLLLRCIRSSISPPFTIGFRQCRKEGLIYWFEDCTQDLLKVVKYWQYPSLYNRAFSRISHRMSCLQRKQKLKTTWVQKKAKGSQTILIVSAKPNVSELISKISQLFIFHLLQLVCFSLQKSNKKRILELQQAYNHNSQSKISPQRPSNKA